MKLGVAQQNAPGELLCGDSYAVVKQNGHMLVAVIDGLGHGGEAHRAADAARQTIEENSELGLDTLMKTVDRAIAKTRGAAVALLRFRIEAATLECSSVGNVEIVADSQERIRPTSTPGIIGRRVKRCACFEYTLTTGDRVAIFSDGISRRLDLSAYSHLDTQQTADAILREHNEGRDDATCMVVGFG